MTTVPMNREDQVGKLSRFRHPLYKILTWASPDSADDFPDLDDREITSSADEADVITSEIEGSKGKRHTVMLDLDVPAQLVPSSTDGHYHLYIDVEMSWRKYKSLLNALGNAGVIEPGYESVSIRRGFTSLRLPWTRKEKP